MFFEFNGKISKIKKLLRKYSPLKEENFKKLEGSPQSKVSYEKKRVYMYRVCVPCVWLLFFKQRLPNHA